jgi:hypothetical protein
LTTTFRKYWSNAGRGILILFFDIVHSLGLNGQFYNQVIFDRQQSQFCGTSDLMTLHRAIYTVEDKYIHDTIRGEKNVARNAAGFGLRVTKLLLLDAQVDGLIALAQHEIFGHGARYREFGYRHNAYNLNLFPPFGDGSGYAQNGSLKKSFTYPTGQERISMTMGGGEAEILMANNLAFQMVLDDSVHYRQSELYLLSQNNLIFYLWTTRFTPKEKIISGNDMVNYMNRVNAQYGSTGGSSYDINLLSNQSLLSILNPLQIYSAVSIVYHYCVRCKKTISGPRMIKLGALRFLPALNYSFTPFGACYHFISYFKHGQRLFIGDVLFGEGTFLRFYGISLKGFNLVDTNWLTLNFHLDVWNQPVLDLENNSKSDYRNSVGQALGVDVLLRPSGKKSAPALFVHTGYKNKGYLIGESLAETFILRYGIAMHF